MIILDGIIYYLQPMGGVSTYFNQVVRAVEKRGGAARLLTIGSGPWSKKDEFPGVCSSASRPRILERARPAEIPRGLKPSLFVSSYYRVCSNPEVPSVTTVHDFIHRKFGSGPRNRAFIMQQSKAIRSANYIICVSESTRRDLLEFYPSVNPDNVRVIHNAASDSFYPVKQIEKEKRALVVGRRSSYKNFILAVDAMHHLPNYHLDIVGGGYLTRSEKSRLDQMCFGRYTWHGNIGDSQLNDLLNRSRVLLYLSEYEGFGIPPLEAMRAGCVPLVKRNSSLPEVVGPHGQFIHGGARDVAARVRELERQSVYKEVQEAGFRRAREFSWAKSMQETLNVFDLASEGAWGPRRARS